MPRVRADTRTACQRRAALAPKSTTPSGHTVAVTALVRVERPVSYTARYRPVSAASAAITTTEPTMLSAGTLVRLLLQQHRSFSFFSISL